MFDIDFSTKRAQLALRFFTYGVMTVATVVLTTIVVFILLGYRLDQHLNFAQGGLVQFRSSPGSADVTIDGVKQSFRTPNNTNLAAGSHKITMSLSGYRDWHKNVNLAAGQLLWLNYNLFIPDKINTSNEHVFNNLAGVLISPDHHWILAQPQADSPTFTLVDTSNEKKLEYTDMLLPDGLLTKKDNKFGKIELVEWDQSSRYILMKHDNGDIHEFVRVDRQKPQESINVTRVFSLNIVEAHFSASNPQIFFAKTDDVLRKLDLSNTSASAAIVTNLKQFILYDDDTVAFVSEQEKKADDPTSKQQIVGIYRHGKVMQVRTLPVTQPTLIAYSEYYSHGYLAIGSKDSSGVDILRDPGVSSAQGADLFSHIDVGARLVNVIFSNNGRILLAQSGNKIATYDLETTGSYAVVLNVGAPITSPLHWLDDFHLWTDAGNKLSILEFDGQNQAKIADVEGGFTSSLSATGHELFSIVKNGDGKFVLQSSKLTTD